MGNYSCSPTKDASREKRSPLLTAEDACAYVQCTRRYLERMVRSGRLRAIKPSPKLLRFRGADLDAFLETGATIGQEK
jgi:excisionase family DNA binding protein